MEPTRSAAATETARSASEIVELVSSRQASVEELTAEHLAFIHADDARVNAWVYLDDDTALAGARAVDAKLATRKARALAGVPMGVKDIFNTCDMPTQMGSPIWEGFTPGNDARVVHYAREADAVVLGKTVTAEFAVHFLPKGTTVNPHDAERSPGTSSSGSAAAVASGHVPLSLGTQTAGSIVRPASYCGVVGFKPSFGLLPRTGMLKTTDTLDTVGCFARSVADVKLLFETIRVRGRDFPILESSMLDGAYSPGEPVTIAYLDSGLPVFDGYQQQTLEAFSARLEELARVPGVTLRRLEPGHDLAEVHDLHATIYDKTLAYYFAEEFEQHTLISGLMYEIVERGRAISTDTYLEAVERQAQIRTRFAEQMAGTDLLITPSTAGPAPLLEAPEPPDTCLIWTFLGLPAVSLPVFTSTEGLPMGLQAVGSRYGDLRLLALSEALLEPAAL